MNHESSRCVILSTTILEPIEDWSSCNIHVCHSIHFRIKFSLQSKQLSMGCHLCQNHKKPSIYKWSAPYTGVLQTAPHRLKPKYPGNVECPAIAIAQHVGPSSSQPPSATSQPSASQSSPCNKPQRQWNSIYGVLHLYMEHSICIWNTPFVYEALHLYM